jgi:hypothetical protein
MFMTEPRCLNTFLFTLNHPSCYGSPRPNKREAESLISWHNKRDQTSSQSTSMEPSGKAPIDDRASNRFFDDVDQHC